MKDTGLAEIESTRQCMVAQVPPPENQTAAVDAGENSARRSADGEAESQGKEAAWLFYPGAMAWADMSEEEEELCYKRTCALASSTDNSAHISSAFRDKWRMRTEVLESGLDSGAVDAELGDAGHRLSTTLLAEKTMTDEERQLAEEILRVERRDCVAELLDTMREEGVGFKLISSPVVDQFLNYISSNTRAKLMNPRRAEKPGISPTLASLRWQLNLSVMSEFQQDVFEKFKLSDNPNTTPKNWVRVMDIQSKIGALHSRNLADLSPMNKDLRDLPESAVIELLASGVGGEIPHKAVLFQLVTFVAEVMGGRIQRRLPLVVTASSSEQLVKPLNSMVTVLKLSGTYPGTFSNNSNTVFRCSFSTSGVAVRTEIMLTPGKQSGVVMGVSGILAIEASLEQDRILSALASHRMSKGFVYASRKECKLISDDVWDALMMSNKALLVEDDLTLVAANVSGIIPFAVMAGLKPDPNCDKYLVALWSIALNAIVTRTMNLKKALAAAAERRLLVDSVRVWASSAPYFRSRDQLIDGLISSMLFAKTEIKEPESFNLIVWTILKLKGVDAIADVKFTSVGFYMVFNLIRCGVFVAKYIPMSHWLTSFLTSQSESQNDVVSELLRSVKRLNTPHVEDLRNRLDQISHVMAKALMISREFRIELGARRKSFEWDLTVSQSAAVTAALLGETDNKYGKREVNEDIKEIVMRLIEYVRQLSVDARIEEATAEAVVDELTDALDDASRSHEFLFKNAMKVDEFMRALQTPKAIGRTEEEREEEKSPMELLEELEGHVDVSGGDEGESPAEERQLA